MISSEHLPSDTQAYQSQQSIHSIHQQLTLLIKGTSHAPSHLAEMDRYNCRWLHLLSPTSLKAVMYSFYISLLSVQAANSQRA